MTDFLDTFFNFNFNELTDLAWGKYQRPFKEVERYRFYKKENKGYILVVNALGVSSEDIKVNITDGNATNPNKVYPRLSIVGETTDAYLGNKYSIDFSIYLKLNEKVESINYDCKDGYCYVFIKTKQPEKTPEIEVKKVEPGKIDW